MLVLAIDTAGADCATALYSKEEDRLIAVRQETIGKGHAERLMGMIDEIIMESDHAFQDVGMIAVTIGPGSFTGIRVGVAAARGLGLALSIPVVGVSTLEALAANARAMGAHGPVLAAIDAKRDEIYCQFFAEDGAATNRPAALTLSDAGALAESSTCSVAGSGASLISKDVPTTEAYDILSVARIAATRQNAPGKPAPLYLRAPDAKPQAGFALKRRG
jgi:tRNA threonylcarbamoyladenosine biosynthesis protein TsaB